MFEKKIFIAEEDNSVALNITTSLKRLGYTVIGQTDRSETTIQKVQELRPDLVLIGTHLRGRLMQSMQPNTFLPILIFL